MVAPTNNGWTNTPESYVIRTLPVFLTTENNQDLRRRGFYSDPDFEIYSKEFISR